MLGTEVFGWYNLRCVSGVVQEFRGEGQSSSSFKGNLAELMTCFDGASDSGQL